MSFLPEDYKRPETGGSYMRLLDGENRIRILSDAVVGFEYWVADGEKRKPMRVRTEDEVPAIEKAKTGKDKVKFFWVMLVWNYKDLKGQILEVTQGTIQSPIENYIEDKDWGDPKNYDLKINKVGEGIETEYSVIAIPPTKFILEGKDIPTVNLSALYDGADPFVKDNATQVKVEAKSELEGIDLEDILNTDEVKIDEPKKTKKDKLIDELIDLFTEMGKSSDEMVEYVQKKFSVDSPSDLSEVKLDTIIKAIRMKLKASKMPKPVEEVPVKTLAQALDEQDLGNGSPTFDDKKGKK